MLVQCGGFVFGYWDLIVFWVSQGSTALYRYPSKSGLINKHTVKHTVSHDPILLLYKHIVNIGLAHPIGSSSLPSPYRPLGPRDSGPRGRNIVSCRFTFPNGRQSCVASRSGRKHTGHWNILSRKERERANPCLHTKGREERNTLHECAPAGRTTHMVHHPRITIGFAIYTATRRFGDRQYHGQYLIRYATNSQNRFLDIE